MDYKQSGVDRNRGYQLVEKIKKNARTTANSDKVLGGIGGFASLYSLLGSNYEEAVLVSSTDGVGSKLKLALDFGVYNTVGQDCVAMCVNDILCSGAQPLFFLDYLACDSLDVNIAAALVDGVDAACASINIPLLGGETAEMPDFYREGLYDLAGFCVGLVERKNICSPKKSAVGDVIIGLSSNGLHSNGFSLVRKVLSECEAMYELDYNQPLLRTENGKKSLKEILLNPTTIYASIVKSFLQSEFSSSIHAMAHITGGGICENLPRALQADQSAEIDRKCIATPEIFHFLQQPKKYLGESKLGESPLISSEEMWATFNMGLGFVLLVAEDAAEKILDFYDQYSSFGQELMVEDTISASILGRVSKRSSPDAPQVVFS